MLALLQLGRTCSDSVQMEPRAGVRRGEGEDPGPVAKGSEDGLGQESHTEGTWSPCC